MTETVKWRPMEGFIKAAMASVLVFWGGLHPTWQVLALLQLLDIITGLIVAGMRGEISSEASFRGMSKKALAWILVKTTDILAAHGPGMVGVEMQIPGGPAVAGYYILTEFVSIVENIGRADPSLVPAPIQAVLEKLGRGGPRK